ncbi:MAG: ABC transporter ATP-binding protein [Solibacillus sp.]
MTSQLEQGILSTTTHTEKSIIEVRNLNQQFKTTSGKTVIALENANLSIGNTEFVSILGPSGCGKSTIMQIMAGLLKQTSGEVLLKGKPMKGTSKDVGVVFQKPALFPWRPVVDNILLSAEVLGLDKQQSKVRAQELLEMIGLGEMGNLYPYELSGGMQQRVGIARALMHDPEILFMDEPFGALDALTRENMGLELLKIWEMKRKTVVFITHSVNEALFLADRIIVMSPRPGRIVEDFQVDLPRPRGLDVMSSPGFNEAAAYLRNLLGASVGD